MAGVEGIALRIASTLRSVVAANPLPVELWGYAPEDAAQLVSSSSMSALTPASLSRKSVKFRLLHGIDAPSAYSLQQHLGENLARHKAIAFHVAESDCHRAYVS